MLKNKLRPLVAVNKSLLAPYYYSRAGSEQFVSFPLYRELLSRQFMSTAKREDRLIIHTFSTYLQQTLCVP